MEKIEIAIYYNTESEDYRAATADTQELERRGIEIQRRTWFNGDYVEAIEAKIGKLEQENKELVEALGKMPCIGNCRSDERDRFYGIKALCFKCTVLTKIKSEGRDE